MPDVSEAAWRRFIEKATRDEAWASVVGRYRASIITRAITEGWTAEQVQSAGRDVKAVAAMVRWIENQTTEGKTDGRKTRYTGKRSAADAAAAGQGLGDGE